MPAQRARPGVTDAYLCDVSMPSGPGNMNELRVVSSNRHIHHIGHNFHNGRVAHNRLNQRSPSNNNIFED
jgi:hypothetical protein